MKGKNYEFRIFDAKIPSLLGIQVKTPEGQHRYCKINHQTYMLAFEIAAKRESTEKAERYILILLNGLKAITPTLSDDVVAYLLSAISSGGLAVQIDEFWKHPKHVFLMSPSWVPISEEDVQKWLPLGKSKCRRSGS